MRDSVTDNAGHRTPSPTFRVGNYMLTVTSPGFQTYSKTNIVINVASTVKEDVPLTVGSNTQTVTVEADASAVAIRELNDRSFTDHGQASY